MAELQPRMLPYNKNDCYLPTDVMKDMDEFEGLTDHELDPGQDSVDGRVGNTAHGK